MVASTKTVRYLGVDLDQSLDGNYISSNSMSFCDYACSLHGLVVFRKFTNKNVKFFKIKVSDYS